MHKNYLQNRLYYFKSPADISQGVETLDRFFDLGDMLDRVGADTAEGERIVNARKNLRRACLRAGALQPCGEYPAQSPHAEPDVNTSPQNGRNAGATP